MLLIHSKPKVSNNGGRVPVLGNGVTNDVLYGDNWFHDIVIYVMGRRMFNCAGFVLDEYIPNIPVNTAA